MNTLGHNTCISLNCVELLLLLFLFIPYSIYFNFLIQRTAKHFRNVHLYYTSKYGMMAMHFYIRVGLYFSARFKYVKPRRTS